MQRTRNVCNSRSPDNFWDDEDARIKEAKLIFVDHSSTIVRSADFCQVRLPVSLTLLQLFRDGKSVAQNKFEDYKMLRV